MKRHTFLYYYPGADESSVWVSFLSNTSFPTSRDLVLTNWTNRCTNPGTSQTCFRRYVRVLCYSESLWGKSPDTGQRLPWRCATVAGSNSRAIEGGEACALTAEPRDWVTVFVIDKVMQVACAHKHCDACYQDGDYSWGTPSFCYNVLISSSYKWKRKIACDLVTLFATRKCGLVMFSVAFVMSK